MATTVRRDNSRAYSRGGVRWNPGFWPEWTQTIDLDHIGDIAHRELHLDNEEGCIASRLGHGTLNQLYLLKTDSGQEYVFRASLPVCSVLKTQSEVATMKLVRSRTSIPIPEIISYGLDSSEMGYEWILMTKIPGRDLGIAGMGLSLDAKRALVRQLAKYQAGLFALRFSGIGNLVTIAEPSGESKKSSSDPSPKAYTVGQCCTYEFFMLDHLSSGIPKGPFDNSAQWLTALLNIFIRDQDRLFREGGTSVSLAEQDPEDVQQEFWNYAHGTSEEACFRKQVAERLKALVQKVFPVDDGSAEQTMLFHHDLHTGNVMVDEEGRLSGIGEETIVQEPAEPKTGEDDFWEYLTEEEQALLREEFLATMRVICPEWIEIREKSVLQTNLGIAVSAIGNPHHTTAIEQWCNAVEKGKFGDDLARRLYVGQKRPRPREEPPTANELALAETLWEDWKETVEYYRPSSS
ncbi:hypothetical protein PMZ80_008950 [Knufia obscura]|uniref:Aminoglycoside phosphotransferase domain-containing protein n=1 Tax=Knufia obscura TaxID=1635080 RepID=A0ABR0RDQ2_9EURO|nr:hypothetical protein PMZ80_008950 [Knufia obscura]